LAYMLLLTDMLCLTHKISDRLAVGTDVPLKQGDEEPNVVTAT